jgi:nitrogen fixation protein FixH
MLDYAIDKLTEDDGDWNVLAVVLAIVFWSTVAASVVTFALWAANNYSGTVAGF